MSDNVIELCPVIKHDIDRISSMIDAAAAHWLVVEVVWSFGESLQGGNSSIEEACRHALREWDL